MKDAFGGAFMIRIFLIFVLIYILLTAVAMNYAKAYKVKELVISYLEDNEIADLATLNAEAETKMLSFFNTEIIGGMNYSHQIDVKKVCNGIPSSHCKAYNFGVRIIKHDPNEKESNKKGSYYTVTTYFGYDIGVIRLLAAGTDDIGTTSIPGVWEITGETRLIYSEKVN